MVDSIKTFSIISEHKQNPDKFGSYTPGAGAAIFKDIRTFVAQIRNSQVILDVHLDNISLRDF